jgi:MFS family permease
MLGGIVSIYAAGGAVGALLSGPVGNRFGRLGAIRFGSVLSLLLSVLLCRQPPWRQLCLYSVVSSTDSLLV